MRSREKFRRYGTLIGLLYILLLDPAIVTSAPVTVEESVYEVEGGCYYMLDLYKDGEQIRTNEPCLNCTCANSMLMCYLKTCPFSKPIGSDCSVERVAGQCCPIIKCPEVPVMIPEAPYLTMGKPETTAVVQVTSTTAVSIPEPDEGCFIDNVFFMEGSQVPQLNDDPCDLCYCIHNHSACVKQQCTLDIPGCIPQYKSGVCCPVSYDCDSSRTLAPPTTTTTLPPSGCYVDEEYYYDGSIIHTGGPCEHCYCMQGKLVCAVQECDPPMEKCTPIFGEDQCCPARYDCPVTHSPDLNVTGYTTEYPESSHLPTSPDEEVTPQDDAAQTHVPSLVAEISTQQQSVNEVTTSSGESQDTDKPFDGLLSDSHVLINESSLSHVTAQSSEPASDEPSTTAPPSEVREGESSESLSDESIKTTNAILPETSSALPEQFHPVTGQSEQQSTTQKPSDVVTSKPENLTPGSVVLDVSTTPYPTDNQEVYDGKFSPEAVAVTSEAPIEQDTEAHTSFDEAASTKAPETVDVAKNDTAFEPELPETTNKVSLTSTETTSGAEVAGNQTETGDGFATNVAPSSEEPTKHPSSDQELLTTELPSTEEDSSDLNQTSEEDAQSTESLADDVSRPIGESSENFIPSDAPFPAAFDEVLTSEPSVIYHQTSEMPVASEQPEEVNQTEQGATDQPSNKPDDSLQTERTPEEKPSEKPEDQSSGKPEDWTTENLSEKPTERPTEDQPSERPSGDQASEKPSDDQASERPAEDQPSERPAEDQPSVKPSEDEPSERPSEDQPSERPSEDQPSEKPSEDQTSDRPAEDQPSERPLADQPSERPAEDQPSERPLADQPSVKPEDPFFDSSTESQISEKPAKDQSSELPVSTPQSSDIADLEPQSTESPVVETKSSEAPIDDPVASEAPPLSEIPVKEPQPSEAPSFDGPTSEAPLLSEAPVDEPQSSEVPAIETQSSEAPASESQSSEASALEPQSSDAPAIESQSSETPAVESQSSEAPAVESQSSEAPALEPQSSKTPTTETLSSEAPTLEPQSSEASALEPQSSIAPPIESQPSEVPAEEPQSTEAPVATTASADLPDLSDKSSEAPISSEESTKVPEAITYVPELKEGNESFVEPQPTTAAGADLGGEPAGSGQQESDITVAPWKPSTTLAPPEETSPQQDEPVAVVPGEGDCQLYDITYKSGQSVPDKDSCQVNCTCLNSIVICEKIECEVPEALRNLSCVEVFEDKKCCPRYICTEPSDPSKVPIPSGSMVTEVPPGTTEVAEATTQAQPEVPQADAQAATEGLVASYSTPEPLLNVSSDVAATTEVPAETAISIEKFEVTTGPSLTDEPSKAPPAGQDQGYASTAFEPESSSQAQPENEQTTSTPEDVSEKLTDQPKEGITADGLDIVRTTESPLADATVQQQDASTASEQSEIEKDAGTTRLPSAETEQAIEKEGTTLRPDIVYVAPPSTAVPESLDVVPGEGATVQSEIPSHSEQPILTPAADEKLETTLVPDHLTTAPSQDIEEKERIGTFAQPEASTELPPVPKTTPQRQDVSTEVPLPVEDASRPAELESTQEYVSPPEDAPELVVTVQDSEIVNATLSPEDITKSTPGRAQEELTTILDVEGEYEKATTHLSVVVEVENITQRPEADYSEVSANATQAAPEKELATEGSAESRTEATTLDVEIDVVATTHVPVTADNEVASTGDKVQLPSEVPPAATKQPFQDEVATSEATEVASGAVETSHSPQTTAALADEVHTTSKFIEDATKVATEIDVAQTTVLPEIHLKMTTAQLVTEATTEPQTSAIPVEATTVFFAEQNESLTTKEPEVPFFHWLTTTLSSVVFEQGATSLRPPVIEDKIDAVTQALVHGTSSRPEHVTTPAVPVFAEHETHSPDAETTDEGDYNADDIFPDVGIPITDGNFTLEEGECIYEKRIYASAQQIPRDDPCDFCFCFRGDIICLQQSCPPPIEGCHEESIPGFCCPRYECPVTAVTLNVTDTKVPYPISANKYRTVRALTQDQVVVCEFRHKFYDRGEFIATASGPCMDCICGEKGAMKCIPKKCQLDPFWQSLPGFKRLGKPNATRETRNQF